MKSFLKKLAQGTPVPGGVSGFLAGSGMQQPKPKRKAWQESTPFPKPHTPEAIRQQQADRYRNYRPQFINNAQTPEEKWGPGGTQVTPWNTVRGATTLAAVGLGAGRLAAGAAPQVAATIPNQAGVVSGATANPFNALNIWGWGPGRAVTAAGSRAASMLPTGAQWMPRTAAWGTNFYVPMKVMGGGLEDFAADAIPWAPWSEDPTAKFGDPSHTMGQRDVGLYVGQPEKFRHDYSRQLEPGQHSGGKVLGHMAQNIFSPWSNPIAMAQQIPEAGRALGKGISEAVFGKTPEFEGAIANPENDEVTFASGKKYRIPYDPNGWAAKMRRSYTQTQGDPAKMQAAQTRPKDWMSKVKMERAGPHVTSSMTVADPVERAKGRMGIVNPNNPYELLLPDGSSAYRSPSMKELYGETREELMDRLKTGRRFGETPEQLAERLRPKAKPKSTGWAFGGQEELDILDAGIKRRKALEEAYAEAKRRTGVGHG